jgi:hypothetical protein
MSGGSGGWASYGLIGVIKEFLSRASGRQQSPFFASKDAWEM